MLACYRAKYSTPRGHRYLSTRAISKESAKAILKNKTPWRAGWIFEGIIEPNTQKERSQEKN